MTAGSGKTRMGLYAIGAGVIASLAVIVVSNVNFLLSTREQSHAAAVRSLENLALSIERSITSEIAERKDDLSGIAQLLESSRLGFADMSGGVGRVLGSVNAFDADGRPVASLATDFPPGDYSQEPFFKGVQHGLDDDVLVTAGILAQAPDTSLVLSRRLQIGTAFNGVIANTVSFARLAGILRRFDLGDGGLVYGPDRGWAAACERPPGVEGPGLDLSQSESYRHIVEYGTGSFDAVSLVDGRRRVYVSRKIADASLLLFVGTSLETVYEPFRAVAALEIAAAVILAGLIGGFALAARYEWRLRRASEQAAELAAIAARRSEGLVTTYFENLAHGVLCIRVQPCGDLAIERVNANAQRLFGVSDSLLGHDPREVFGAGVLPEFVPQLQHCLQTQRLSQRTVPFKIAGRMHSLRLTVTPVFDEVDGTITLLLASLEDVTFHEIAQAKLLQTHRMNGIERITSGVANEFNNLLQSMIGHLEMLAEEVEGDATAEPHARSALDAAARGTRLTQGLLSSSSQQLLQPETVLPERKLARLARMFEAKRNPRIRLMIEGGARHPPGACRCGPPAVRLAQYLRERAGGHAARWRGTVTVRAFARDALSPGVGTTGRFVVFSVTDDGAGMTPDVLARAREPFFTTKGERFRSGLGLSMADGFARQSGGELTLESSAGKGTTVELSLASDRGGVGGR